MEAIKLDSPPPIGSQLRQLRAQHQLSQESFGALGGVSASSQSQYENNISVPDINYLRKLSAKGINIAPLVNIKTQAPPLTVEMVSLIITEAFIWRTERSQSLSDAEIVQRIQQCMTICSSFGKADTDAIWSILDASL